MQKGEGELGVGIVGDVDEEGGHILTPDKVSVIFLMKEGTPRLRPGQVVRFRKKPLTTDYIAAVEIEPLP